MTRAEFQPIMLGTGLGTYSLARLLHSAFGVHSIALGRAPLRETAHSRIVDVEIPADFDNESVITDSLMTMTQRYPDQKLLLLPMIEFYTNVVLANYELLSDKFLIPLPDRAVADQLLSKASFYELCAQLGVAHPVSYAFTESALDEPGFGADWELQYPVILKPSNTDLYPRVHFAGKKKVYSLDSLEQVREVSRQIFTAGYDDALIAQEYLAGDESVMSVVNVYSDRHAEVKFCSVGQVVLSEYNPQLVGNNNAIVAVRGREQLVESVKTVLNGAGYRGLANIDAMWDPRSGEYKLLEANLRPGATSFYTRAGGENLARFLVNDLVFHKDIPEIVNVTDDLWLNLPYFAARHYAPTSTRDLLTGKRATAWHTLKYPPDMSWRRRIDIWRLELDRMWDYHRYSKNRLNV
ncbi:MAG: hypothetical protein FWG25_07835 [Promicromonosporaceae bacterium]|nr:hypothetical protein [Promicromonosporaceae bacterium]